MPLIAAGEIADSRTFLSALGAGAEGGTRFIATEECPTHPNMKQAILDASIMDTVAIKHGKHPSPLEKPRIFKLRCVEDL